MYGEVGFRVKLGVAVILLNAAGLSWAMVNVVNYDNHPDLEKAKAYDLTLSNRYFERGDGTFDRELYQSYVAQASRELAEQHYLAYLHDVNDSFQRAAVYARLGEMYSGGARPAVATRFDRDKARGYYRQALEAEPERIGWATLQARGFFATDGATSEERFASYMDYYQWLRSIDEKTLTEKLLPIRPPGTRRPRRRSSPELNEARKRRAAWRIEGMEASAKNRPPQSQSRGGGFLDLIKSQAETTAYNLVHEAVGPMAMDLQTGQWSETRAVQYLTLLAERFPDASVAKRAQTELARIARGEADYMVTVSEKDFEAKSRPPAPGMRGQMAPRTREQAVDRTLSRGRLGPMAGAWPDWKIRTMVWPSAEEIRSHRVTADDRTTTDCLGWLGKFLRPAVMPKDPDKQLVAMANWGLYKEEAEQQALLDVFICRLARGPYAVHIQESPFNVVISVADKRLAHGPREQAAHERFIIQIASELLHQDILPDWAEDLKQHPPQPGADGRALTRVQWQPASVVIEEPGRSWWSVDPEEAGRVGTHLISAETDGAYVRFDVVKATGGGPRTFYDPYARRFDVSP